jgi:YggT family protein
LEEVKRDMALAQMVRLFFDALWLLIIIYVLGSWIPSLQRQPWFRTLRGVVEPLLVPFRRIIPPENLGGLDLSPVFLMLALSLVQQVLMRALIG